MVTKLQIVRLSRALSEEAVAHLSAVDPVMRRIIEAVGPFSLGAKRNRFHTLVNAIISQQISTAAARSILSRLEKTVGRQGLSPESVLRLTPSQFRRAGVSPQKQNYLKDLARKIVREEVRLNRLGRMSDDDVISQLVQVKGIGRWTAQMFLIFTLTRADVFPHEDFGVRTALKRAYRLKDLPDKTQSHRIAEPWRPYATVGSWYCWRSLALPPAFFTDLPTEMKPNPSAGR